MNINIDLWEENKRLRSTVPWRECGPAPHEPTCKPTLQVEQADRGWRATDTSDSGWRVELERIDPHWPGRTVNRAVMSVGPTRADAVNGALEFVAPSGSGWMVVGMTRM